MFDNHFCPYNCLEHSERFSLFFTLFELLFHIFSVFTTSGSSYIKLTGSSCDIYFNHAYREEYNGKVFSLFFYDRNKISQENENVDDGDILYCRVLMYVLNHISVACAHHKVLQLFTNKKREREREKPFKSYSVESQSYF